MDEDPADRAPGVTVPPTLLADVAAAGVRVVRAGVVVCSVPGGAMEGRALTTGRKPARAVITSGAFAACTADRATLREGGGAAGVRVLAVAALERTPGVLAAMPIAGDAVVGNRPAVDEGREVSGVEPAEPLAGVLSGEREPVGFVGELIRGLESGAEDDGGGIVVVVLGLLAAALTGLAAARDGVRDDVALVRGVGRATATSSLARSSSPSSSSPSSNTLTWLALTKMPWPGVAAK